MKSTLSRSAKDRPSLDIDLYRTELMRNPVPAYQTLRDAGRAVWLPKHRMWAMGRYADVRWALRNDELFTSADGVSPNNLTNRLGQNTTLVSDGSVHRARRKVLMESLGATALKPITPTLEREAEVAIEELLGRNEFDGISDFASRLPVHVIADLVGVHVKPSRLLRWGRVSFDTLGPLGNWRTLRGIRTGLGLWSYTTRLTSARVEPGSWSAKVLAAGELGEVSMAEAKAMVIDFVAPSLDTTILATGQLLWSLGTTPGVWNRIISDPSLISAAVLEAVRLSSPVRGFTRTLAEDVEVDDVVLRKGDRVMLVYASANMDETQFPDPGRFDLDRRGMNVGWGYGSHACAGMYLAKLEMQTLLHAMVPRISKISVSDPQRLINNNLQGFQSFRAKFE